MTCSLLVLLLGVVHAQPSREELSERLKDLKRKEQQFKNRLNSTVYKRNQTREKYRQSKRKENRLLELINRYQNLQQQSQNRLDKLKQREKRAKERLQEINRKFEKARNRLENREKKLMARLRDIYKQGQLMQTRMLVNVENLTELMTNYRYYRRLVKYDRDLINQYRNTKKEIKQLREQRRNVYEKRKKIRKQVEATLKKREQILSSRRDFLNEIQDKRQLYEQRLRELENRQQKLKERVFLFQQQRSEAKAKMERITGQFGKRKGELPWPVDSREILRPYGTWTRNGIVHNNDGIDIGTESGQQVRAVASGKVVFANEYQGIGKVVIVRHNDSFITLYGSLIDVSVSKGQDVKENMVVGRAGQTAGMDQPRLYFQIFEGKETLDPIEWLS